MTDPTTGAATGASPGAPPEILTERRGAVQWVIFNRPHARNAITPWMEDRLIEICRAVNSDPGIKALALTGATGDKPAFMAGADLSCLQAVASPEDFTILEIRAEAAAMALEAVRVPTVAVLSGACVGEGALLASCCDVRIASPSVRFGFPIARTVGNCLSVRNLARLSAVLGTARTKEMIFSARLLTADELAAAGALRNVTAGEEELTAHGQSVAEELAALAPLTLWATREGLRRLRDQGLPPDIDADLLRRCYLSADYQEGIAAFFEKRRPAWSGR
ncbi:enoyl-CoA hydratase/carnithine racemase [Azospirillum agricola]|uniref:enoyl-CoA hydratase n=1 Tax=Azospirillum agricola TaxID=1720247 RepID=UPI001AE2655F|nr:enoyl-CoA hydratase [Azospirillum agricola]MBP2227827.1 enoyl-CoA hydratase/carnithine racemase [Azospirillum agricola]